MKNRWLSAIPFRHRKWIRIPASKVTVEFALVRSLLLVTLFAASTRATAEGDNQEHVVKAAFIYNFAKFVDWPNGALERPDSPIVIGIVGKDPFGQTIDRAIQGKSIGGRGLVVKRFAWDADLKGCQILFIGTSEKGKFGQLAGILKGAPVLTIGESPGFAGHFGIINFIMEDGRVRFEINADAAKRARLNVSSKLLSLAKVVPDSK